MNDSEAEILSQLQKIDEYLFEQLVAGLWETRGWTTKVTSGSNDRGVDVIAEKQNPFHQKQLIQAKRYSQGNKIGSPDIQQYSSLKHQFQNVDNVVVVTTSDFTSQARDIANSLNVKLINGRELVSLIVETDPEDLLEEYFPDDFFSSDSNSSSGLKKSTSDNLSEISTQFDENKIGTTKNDGSRNKKAHFNQLLDYITQLYHESLDNDKIGDFVFEYNDKIDGHYQLMINEEEKSRSFLSRNTQKRLVITHNITKLCKEQMDVLREMVDGFGLHIESQGDSPVGHYITISSEVPPDDINFNEVAKFSQKVLTDIYSISIKDINEFDIWAP